MMSKLIFYTFVFLISFEFQSINAERNEQTHLRDLETEFYSLLESPSDRSAKRSNEAFQIDQYAETSANHLNDPVRIAFFNGGRYDAHVMINYIYNDYQKESALDSKILENDERTMYLPNNVTNIRIRVSFVGVVHDGYVIDEQIRNFDQTKERCYVLAGTRSRPMYGLCPGPFEHLIQIW